MGRGDAYESKDDPDHAIQDYHQAIKLKLKDDIYSAIWRYLARERAGENGAAELEANAARVKGKDWPVSSDPALPWKGLTGGGPISRQQPG